MARRSYAGSAAKAFADSFLAAQRENELERHNKAMELIAQGKNPNQRGANSPWYQNIINSGNNDPINSPFGNNSSSSASGPTSASGTDFERFRNALTGEESGGKYGILGPTLTAKDGSSRYAVGRYQIMSDNVPSWTKQYLGQAMTPEQFRANPQAQDAVFQGKVNDLLKQNNGNWRDVASIWHSGVPYDQAVREGRRDVNETTANYVDHVMAKSGIGNSRADPANGVTTTPSASTLTGASPTSSGAGASSPASSAFSPASPASSANTGPNNIYANIPAKDSKGRDQLPMFTRWNPNPVGNEASNLKQLNPDMQKVIARARADNPGLNFVLGNGKRSAADQDWAKSVGWSQVGSKDGGDAATHMQGKAADLWPLDSNGRVTFDPAAQAKVTAAIKAAAQKEGVNLNAGDDWRHPDKPHFELASPNTPRKGPNAGKQAQAAPEGPPVLHDVASADAQNVEADTMAPRGVFRLPGSTATVNQPDATNRVTPIQSAYGVNSQGDMPGGGVMDRQAGSPNMGYPAQGAAAPDTTSSDALLPQQPLVNTVRPDAPGMGGRGLPPAPTLPDAPPRVGSDINAPLAGGLRDDRLAPATPPVSYRPEDSPRAVPASAPTSTDAPAPITSASQPYSSPARTAIPSNPAGNDPRFVQVSAPNQNPGTGRGMLGQQGDGERQSTALNLSHLWGPNPPLSQRADQAPPQPTSQRATSQPTPDLAQRVPLDQTPQPPTRQQDSGGSGGNGGDWSDVPPTPDFSGMTDEMVMGSAKGGPITQRVRRFAAGGAIPAKPTTAFYGGGSGVDPAPQGPAPAGRQAYAPTAGFGTLETAMGTLIPQSGPLNIYGSPQNPADQASLAAWNKLTPDQQTWYTGAQTALQQGIYQPSAMQDMLYKSIGTPPPGTPAAAAPAAAPPPAAAAPTPPAAENIVQPVADTTVVDPTTTTITGAPGLPNSIIAKSYDPNVDAQTGAGFANISNVGGTDYSVGSDDLLAQNAAGQISGTNQNNTTILSRKGGPIPPRHPNVRVPATRAANGAFVPQFRRGGRVTPTSGARDTSEDRNTRRSNGVNRYDDGGGVSPSAIGSPPGMSGGAPPPPIYYNPATYAPAGAPIGKGVTQASAATFGAGAIPSLPMARGGAVPARRYANGGMVTGLPSDAAAYTRRFDDGGGVTDAPNNDIAEYPDLFNQSAPADPKAGDDDWYISGRPTQANAPSADSTPVSAGGVPPSLSALWSGNRDNNPPADPTTPQGWDDQGNPGKALIAAIGTGLHWLGEHLGISTAQAGTITPAMASDPVSLDNRQKFASNHPDGDAYLSQDGLNTHNATTVPDDPNDINGDFAKAARPVLGLEKAYRYALLHGDEKSAGQLMASMLHASVVQSQQLSAQARQALYNNDPQRAVELMNDAADAIPDGRLMHATLNDDGTVTVQGQKQNGELLWEKRGMAQSFLEAATAAGVSGKLQWNALESQVANHDPTFKEAQAYRQRNLIEQGKADQDARDDAAQNQIFRQMYPVPGQSGSNPQGNPQTSSPGNSAPTGVGAGAGAGASAPLATSTQPASAPSGWHDTQVGGPIDPSSAPTQAPAGAPGGPGIGGYSASPLPGAAPSSAPAPTASPRPSAYSPSSLGGGAPSDATPNAATLPGLPSAPTNTSLGDTSAPNGVGAPTSGGSMGTPQDQAQVQANAQLYDPNVISTNREAIQQRIASEYIDPNTNQFKGGPPMPPHPATIPGFANLPVARQNSIISDYSKSMTAYNEYQTSQRNAMNSRINAATGDYNNDLISRRQAKVEQDKIDATAKAEADKLRLQQQQPMAPEQLRGIFTKVAQSPDSGMTEGSMPLDWLANTPHYANDANGNKVTSPQDAKQQMGLDFDNPASPKPGNPNATMVPDQPKGGSVGRINLLNNALVNTQQFNPRVSTDQIADLLMGGAKGTYDFQAAKSPPIDDGWGLRQAVIFTRHDGSQQTILVPAQDYKNLTTLANFSLAKNDALGKQKIKEDADAKAGWNPKAALPGPGMWLGDTALPSYGP